MEINENGEIQVLDIPSNTGYWFVRANSRAKYYEDFKKNNYIAVDSNTLPISKLFEIPATIRGSEDALLDKYKQIFQENDLNIFNNLPQVQKMSTGERKKAKSKEAGRSTYRAKRVFNFIEKFNIGDFVVVPYKSSRKFLIGIIVSECFEDDIDHMESLDELGQLTYDISNFEFKRRVLWVKELSRKNFPDKLSWIKTAHQSIFNIKDFANDLNPYITPFYKYQDNFYSRIGVNTSKKISSSSWLDYQLTLQKIVGDENLEDVYQKQRVQSPGDIVIYALSNAWWLIPLIISSLFGEIEINQGQVKIKMQGVIRYFSKGERLKRKLIADNATLEVIQKEANVRKTDAETLSSINNTVDDNETKKVSTDATKSIAKAIANRQRENLERIEQSFTEKDDKKSINTATPRADIDTAKLQNKFQFSNEDPGFLIPYESQEDNLNPSGEEHE